MKKILFRVGLIIGLTMLFCSCSVNEENNEDAAKDVAYPLTIDDWRDVAGNYETYFEKPSIRSQQILEDCFYSVVVNVTEEEYIAYIDNLTAKYPNNMTAYYSVDGDGYPMNTFYGETEDGAYRLTANLSYNEYIDKDSLAFTISCDKIIEETEGE